MSATYPATPLTPEAYLEWEKTQPEKHEYLNGNVYAMVEARDAHVTVAGNAFALLREHLRGGPCRAFISDMKLRVEQGNAFFYPDVFVTCDPRDLVEEYFKRYPVLVIEVLSDTTAAFDRGRKFALYRRLESLREYVLIDPDSFTVDCFRRDDSGHWVLFAYEGEAVAEFDSVDFKVALALLFENVERTDR
ncbi:MAG: Uma2 family endonuclease [Gammaproteobacteria bacterium]